MFKKNTAVTGFSVGLVSATDGSDITTGTPVGYYTLDGSTQTAIADVTPVHEGNGLWSFDLTAGEMNGDIVALTFTHASAITQHFTIKTDTSIASDLNTLILDVPTVAEFNARTLAAAAYFDPSTDGVIVTTNNDKTGYTVSTVSDKTGYSLTQVFPTNFADLAITATTGLTSVGTNNDKTGYTASTVSDKTGYSLTVAPLTAAGVRSAVGLATANMDTQFVASATATGFATEAKQDTAQTDITAILADTASIGVTKNAAFNNLEFLMVDATDHVTPETALTVTGQVSIDGGAFGAIAGTIAEVSNGIYQADLLAADTNGDVITLRFSATGAADRFITIKTRA